MSKTHIAVLLTSYHIFLYHVNIFYEVWHSVHFISFISLLVMVPRLGYTKQRSFCRILNI